MAGLNRAQDPGIGGKPTMLLGAYGDVRTNCGGSGWRGGSASGRRRVYAGGGNDAVRGGKGADVLFGNTGNDTMYGGRNPGSNFDGLVGGPGADALYGGPGKNTLVDGREPTCCAVACGTTPLWPGVARTRCCSAVATTR